MREPKDITILVVDDDPDLRNVIVFDFKRRGFQTLEAGSGHEAFAILNREKVDLILSDVKMPDGDGIELLDRTRAMRPVGPPVILITAFSEISVMEACARGAEAVFSKPFNRKALMKAILETMNLPPAVS